MAFWKVTELAKSFGELFGDLIKARRGIEGLTQQALAVLAFGDEGAKTRISELENGKVARPHAKIVDAIITALDISKNEIDKILNKSPHPGLVDNLSDFFDLGSAAGLHVEIAIGVNQEVDEVVRVFLFHSCRMKSEIKRLEFFVEESMLVWVTADQKRRPLGLELREDVAKLLNNFDEVQAWLQEGERSEAVLTGTYPLKIIQ